MKIHHVDHTGANRKYYLGVLGFINRRKRYGVTVTKSSLGEFITEGVPKGTDILSYQTFPDEYNPKKFNEEVIRKADLQFHSFEGKKILIDTNDCGDKDSFSRMPFSREMPRVKCYPTKWFLENFNVVLVSSVSGNPGVYRDSFNRTIEVSCKFGKKVEGFYGHPIRETVVQYLSEDFPETDFTWVNDKISYFKELQWTKIVVGAPGWGRHNASYWGAFKAGAMLFAHRCLNDIKLFPHSDLIDGDDYVSYDLFNFKTKLRRVLDDPDEFDRIRNNGRQKFADGLNYKKSADQLIKFLKGG